MPERQATDAERRQPDQQRRQLKSARSSAPRGPDQQRGKPYRDRRYGYGGYKYDGRWKAVAEGLVKEYDLKPDARILDVGAGKGFLMHELKLLVNMMHEGGMAYMRYSISDTAEYGDYTRGPRVVNEQTKAEMKKILKEIQSGEFAREWIGENETGGKRFPEMRAKAAKHPIEDIGARLREMMPWIKANKIVDKAKN